MTLQELKDKYQSNVRNFTVANLKADRVFMSLCRKDEEFRDWVLSERSDMANKKRFTPKFLGLAGAKPVSREIVKPEPVETISKTAQIMKDLKAYREKKGFL